MKLACQRNNQPGVDRKVPNMQRGKTAACFTQLFPLWVKTKSLTEGPQGDLPGKRKTGSVASNGFSRNWGFKT